MIIAQLLLWQILCFTATFNTKSSFAFASPLNVSFENCSIQSADEFTCHRCSSGFILFEGKCVQSDRQIALENCLERTKYNDCMLCDCGFSLHQEINRCVVTPPGITGCQVFQKRLETICVRPKPEYEITQSDQGSFISIRLSDSLNCEIRSQKSNECLRCHSGYVLNEITFLCTKVQHSLENVYMSFYKGHQLMSRDFGFVALPSGVYPIISNCLQYALNPSTNWIECVKCVLGRARTESGQNCVRKPFEKCDIVSDHNQNECKQCEKPLEYFIDENKGCIRRNTNQQFDACLEYYPLTYNCMRCVPPFVEILFACVLPNYSSSTIANQHNSLKLAQLNCAYSIQSDICLECVKGFLLTNTGICLEQLKELNDCGLLDIKGKCLSCQNANFQLQNGLCISTYDNTCQKEVLGTYGLECEFCNGNYFPDLLTRQCIQGFNNCESTNGRDHDCIRCQSRFYLYENYGIMLCRLVDSFEYCLSSDGIRNKCLICHPMFELNSQGLCESRIKHDGQRCEMVLSYLAEGSPYCIPHRFEGQGDCVEFHTKENRCLRCQSMYYLDQASGACIQIKGCKYSNGIDKQCILASSSDQYISDDGWLVKQNDECMTNQRDNICLTCTINNDVEGRISSDDGQCTALHLIGQRVIQNCISVRKMLVQEKLRYACVLCLNLYYVDEENGYVCKQITDSKCEISDGKVNQCLYCSLQFVNQSYQIRYQMDAGNRCALLTRRVEDIPFCRQAINGTCYESIRNCKVSLGIKNQCHECEQSNRNPQRQCQLYNCSTIDEKTGHCLACEPDYHLEDVEDGSYLCIHDSNNKCELRWRDGACKQCKRLYYIHMLSSNMNCVRIAQPNCIDLNSSNRRCAACEKGFFLSQQLNCLPINDRCVEYVHSVCSKCHPQYYLTEWHTCEGIDHCVEITDNRCTKCSSSYYLANSQYAPFCLRLPFCEYSLGYHAMCLRCQQGYVFTNFMCFVPNQIQNCQEYDEYQQHCIKCNSLYFLADENTLNGIECVPITVDHCQESDGVLNQCALCKYTGYALSNSNEQCERISNCLYSNGINKCHVCNHGWYSTSTDQELILADSCVKQIGIDNCEIYSVDAPTCKKCKNFYFLTNTNHSCDQLDEAHKVNCLESDGIEQRCFICQEGFINIMKPFNPKAYECKKLLIRYVEGCSQYDHLMLTCVRCFKNMHLVVEKVNQNYIQRCQFHEQIIPCAVYDTLSDSCLQCRSGFLLMHHHNGQCEQIEKQKQVPNCSVYETNSAICKECVHEANLGFVQYWLDRVNNACVNVAQKMCRVLAADYSQECLERFIHKCLLYETRTLSQSCIKCEEGFFLREGLCFEHRQIAFCAQYDAHQEDVCKKCRLHYRVSSNKKQCILSLVENCASYSDDQSECNLCEKMFSIDEATGRCIRSDIAYCLKVAQKHSLNGSLTFECKECYSKWLRWNPKSQQCETMFLIDSNCERSSEIDSTCEVCKSGYFLNDKHECLSQFNLRCGLLNCIEYSKNSSSDLYSCLVCSSGYIYDSTLLTCVRIISTHVEEEQELNEESDYDQGLSSGVLLFISVLLIVVIIILIYQFCKKYTHSQKIKGQLHELSISNSRPDIADLTIIESL